MATSAGISKRRSIRIPANTRVTVLHESQGRQIGQGAWTVDVCPLGVRIRSFGALVPEQTVTLIPSEDSSKPYRCRVVWVSPTGAQLYSEPGLEFWAVAKPIARSQLN
jgi:hypothetical protein